MTKFLSPVGLLLAVGLTLPACTPTRGIEVLNTLDAAAEVQTDAVLVEVVKRLCSAPVDILARNAAQNRDTAMGMYLMCPQVRELVEAVNSARGGAVAAPVEIPAIRLVPE